MYATIRRARMCYTEKCRQITKFEGPAPVCVQIDMLVRIGEWMNKLTDSASISSWGPMFGYLGPSPDASSNGRHITPYCLTCLHEVVPWYTFWRSCEDFVDRQNLTIFGTVYKSPSVSVLPSQYAYGRRASVAFLSFLLFGALKAWKRCWWTPWAK